MTDTADAPRRPRAPVVPAHYRLSKESWEEIVEAYRNGATARELAVKWKVAPGSVYYHACRDGWGKKKNGDDRARAHARAVEAAEAVRAETAPDDKAARLFDGIGPPQGEDDEADHSMLARAAVVASGRAMRGRLWAEAKALAGLAESYARLETRAARGVVTTETMELKLLYDVLTDESGLASRRLGLWSEGEDDPERPLKEAYWRWYGKRHAKATKQEMAIMNRLYDAEHRLKALGEYPPPPRRDYECEPIRNAGKGRKDDSGGDGEGEGEGAVAE